MRYVFRRLKLLDDRSVVVMEKPKHPIICNDSASPRSNYVYSLLVTNFSCGVRCIHR